MVPIILGNVAAVSAVPVITADPFVALSQAALQLGLDSGPLTLTGIQQGFATMYEGLEGVHTLGENAATLASLAQNASVDAASAARALTALVDGIGKGRVRFKKGPKTWVGAAVADHGIAGVLTPEKIKVQSVVRRLLAAKDMDEAIRLVLMQYPEMTWLTGSVNITPEAVASDDVGKSISIRLYGQQHVEFDRTALGIMAVLWVVRGEYDKFTAAQDPKKRLTLESFEALQQITRTIFAEHPEMMDALVVYMLAFDALTVYMVDNDLGKISSVVQLLKDRAGEQFVDHDKILFKLLSTDPKVSPSFNRLDSYYQKIILEGLKAEFNMGQFMQGENVPASLKGLEGLSTRGLDFYLLHFVYDLAGVLGHVRQDGSAVLTEGTFRNFNLAVDALRSLRKGVSLKDVYDSYIGARAQNLGIKIDSEAAIVITKACCLFAIDDKIDAEIVARAYLKLPPNVRTILEAEAMRTGVDDGWAILLYYSPALLRNTRATLQKRGDDDPLEKAATMGLTAMARIYSAGRGAIKNRSGSGVYTIKVDALANMVKTNPEGLLDANIWLKRAGDDAEADFGLRPRLDLARFPRMNSLSEVPGDRIVLLGIGGGSDLVQAAQLGRQFQKIGKKVPAVIEVRSAVTGSQDSSGNMGDHRTVEHTEEDVIAPGVFKIRPGAKMNGRAFAPIIAKDFPVYVIFDEKDGSLRIQIEAVLKHLGGVQNVIAVDTGGDALYGPAEVDGQKATPDQDRRVLEALAGVSVPVTTVEIAVGVDAPDNAESALMKAGARYYLMSGDEEADILATYAMWRIDGSDEALYAKTAYSWQAALRGKRGLYANPLPRRIVTDAKNPWNPFVYLTDAMKAVFFMDHAAHLAAINASR